jgi:hypothetical protein
MSAGLVNTIIALVALAFLAWMLYRPKVQGSVSYKAMVVPLANIMDVGFLVMSHESISGEKVGSITTVTDSTTIAPGTAGTATASCTNGKVLSGGHEVPPFIGGTGMLGAHVDKKTDNGWTASAVAFGATPQTLTAYAYCLDN